jgi:prolyl-tRNA editing enzyme YbaK/EbsC (Cys-tRNA(Pro) deacylase)
MALEKVISYFEHVGLRDRVMVFEQSSATVELAALAVGCEPAHIAKTMSFLQGDKAILIVTAGDARIENKKYKAIFHQKAKMIPWDEVEGYIGHAPGGVCPFEIKEGVVYE